MIKGLSPRRRHLPARLAALAALAVACAAGAIAAPQVAYSSPSISEAPPSHYRGEGDVSDSWQIAGVFFDEFSAAGRRDASGVTYTIPTAACHGSQRAFIGFRFSQGEEQGYRIEGEGGTYIGCSGQDPPTYHCEAYLNGEWESDDVYVPCAAGDRIRTDFDFKYPTGYISSVRNLTTGQRVTTHLIGPWVSGTPYSEYSLSRGNLDTSAVELLENVRLEKIRNRGELIRDYPYFYLGGNFWQMVDPTGAVLVKGIPQTTRSSYLLKPRAAF